MSPFAWVVMCPDHVPPVLMLDHGRADLYAAEHHGLTIELVRMDEVAELVSAAYQRGIAAFLDRETTCNSS